MSYQPLSKAMAEQAVAAVIAHSGNCTEAAISLGIARSTFNNRLRVAEHIYHLKVPTQEAPDLAMPSQADVLNRKLDKLQKEKDALATENRRLRDGQLSADFIRELVSGTTKIPDPPDWFVEREKQGGNHGVPTLLCSDLHWGETVEPAQVNYVNAYNREIAEKRMRKMVEKTINLMLVHMAKPKYDYLCLPLLGDMLSGNIHEELRETNWAPINLCLMEMRDILIWAIDEFLNAFKKVHSVCMTGNHGRLDRKPRYKNAIYDNFEFVLYEMLRHHYRKEKAIHFDIPASSEWIYDAGGMRYLACHGDGFKGGSGIAGALSPMMIGRARKKESAIATNRPFDCIIHGHWHYYRNIGDIISNGTLKGYDEYALKESFVYQEPIQALWVTYKGRITASWPIYLQDRGEVYR